jgi:hypothetical protein
VSGSNLPSSADTSPIKDVLDVVRATAAHFSGTDAPLGLAAEAALAKWHACDCELQAAYGECGHVQDALSSSDSALGEKR